MAKESKAQNPFAIVGLLAVVLIVGVAIYNRTAVDGGQKTRNSIDVLDRDLCNAGQTKYCK